MKNDQMKMTNTNAASNEASKKAVNDATKAPAPADAHEKNSTPASTKTTK